MTEHRRGAVQRGQPPERPDGFGPVEVERPEDDLAFGRGRDALATLGPIARRVRTCG